jgi:hypothetical protein
VWHRPPCGRSLRLGGCVALFLLVVWLSVLPTAAGANDASLKATLATWSRRIAADARSLQVSARQRHPRLLTTMAGRFRRDALAARRALLASRASSSRGVRARRLAVAAFAQYALVGREWALAGQARLRKRRPASIRYASIAKRHARQGGQLLINAGKLLA